MEMTSDEKMMRAVAIAGKAVGPSGVIMRDTWETADTEELKAALALLPFGPYVEYGIGVRVGDVSMTTAQRDAYKKAVEEEFSCSIPAIALPVAKKMRDKLANERKRVREECNEEIKTEREMMALRHSEEIEDAVAKRTEALEKQIAELKEESNRKRQKTDKRANELAQVATMVNEFKRTYPLA